MARITIVLEDLPRGAGCTVQTDAHAPTVGRQYTPAQLLANSLLRACVQSAEGVQFGNGSASLAGELLNCQQE